MDDTEVVQPVDQAGTAGANAGLEAADEAVEKMVDDGEKVAEQGLVQLTEACKIWIRKELSMALAGHSEETRQAENP